MRDAYAPESLEDWDSTVAMDGMFVADGRIDASEWSYARAMPWRWRVGQELSMISDHGAKGERTRRLLMALQEGRSRPREEAPMRATGAVKRLAPRRSGGPPPAVWMILALGVAAIAVVPAPVVAAECELRATGWAPLGLWRGVLFLDQEITCSGKAAGSYRVEAKARSGKQSKTMPAITGEVRAGGRWPRTIKIAERYFPSSLCELPPDGEVGARLEGVGDDERVTYPVEVGFELRGTGDLASVVWRGSAEFRCPSCGEPKGSLRLADDGAYAATVGPKTTVEVLLDLKWYACARRDATLEVLYFVGDSDQELTTAVRPMAVQVGLEKLLLPQGDAIRLTSPVPIAALCQSGKSRVAWEVWGRGELRRVAGGRSFHRLLCGKSGR